MPDVFDETRLDDPAALSEHDHTLRSLAEAGARVRREVAASEPDLEALSGEGPPRAVLAAAREGVGSGRVIAVVQPHRFTRLRDHMEDFEAAFNDADLVYAAPVYAAGEQPIEGVDSAAMVAGMKARGHRSAQVIDGPDALAETLAHAILPGDMIVCLGAGDITKWAAGLADAIRTRRD